MMTKILATVGLLLCIAAPASAAEQGSVGTTSSASVSITIVIPPRIKVDSNSPSFARTGDPRYLAISNNFQGNFSVEKIAIDDPGKGMHRAKPLAGSAGGQKRYALVIVPSIN
jgi:hypothetical protein